MNRRVPNGTHGGVRGRKSPLETFSYSIDEREKSPPRVRSGYLVFLRVISAYSSDSY